MQADGGQIGQRNKTLTDMQGNRPQIFNRSQGAADPQRNILAVGTQAARRDDIVLSFNGVADLL